MPVRQGREILRIIENGGLKGPLPVLSPCPDEPFGFPAVAAPLDAVEVFAAPKDWPGVMLEAIRERSEGWPDQPGSRGTCG